MVIQEDEADDLLESVDRSLRQLRYGALSLLQVEASMPRRVLDILVENFEVDEDVVLRTSDRLGLCRLHGAHRAAPAGAEGRAVCAARPVGRARRRGDLRRDPLLRTTCSTTRSSRSPRWSRSCGAAVKDPHVVAIKMTLYRIGQDSPLVDMLIEAAEAGKQVAVLVELKARFDERNNIIWANRLEQAGIHVVYGLVNLKTHCKLCLVVRQEPDGIRRYAHIGTGNYNAATAQVYTDLGYFTSEAAILDDVSEVFNYLTGYSNKRAYTRAAGRAGRACGPELRALIEREVGARQGGPPGAPDLQEQRASPTRA